MTLFFLPDDLRETDSLICQICLERILGGASLRSVSDYSRIGEVHATLVTA